MNPRINLSPQIAASVPIVSTKMRFTGKSNWVHSARPPARMNPKMNLKTMVTALTIISRRAMKLVSKDSKSFSVL